MSRRGRKPTIAGQFVPIRLDMLESPAFRMLGPVALRILHRLEIEHMRHGGKENGRLPCTYADFERYGIRRKSIRRGIEEAAALGFLEVTERGRMAAYEFRVPSRYRLTYLPARAESGYIPATDEWARFKTEEQVAARLKALRTKPISTGKVVVPIVRLPTGRL